MPSQKVPRITLKLILSFKATALVLRCLAVNDVVSLCLSVPSQDTPVVRQASDELVDVEESEGLGPEMEGSFQAKLQFRPTLQELQQPMT